LMPVKFNGVLATLVRVTCIGALVVPTGCFPKASNVVERLTAVPGPVKASACGLAGSESLMPSTPFLFPMAEGPNVTEMVQLAPARRLAPQLLVWAKSLAFAPAT